MPRQIDTTLTTDGFRVLDPEADYAVVEFISCEADGRTREAVEQGLIRRVEGRYLVEDTRLGTRRGSL